MPARAGCTCRLLCRDLRVLVAECAFDKTAPTVAFNASQMLGTDVPELKIVYTPFPVGRTGRHARKRRRDALLLRRRESKDTCMAADGLVYNPVCVRTLGDNVCRAIQ